MKNLLTFLVCLIFQILVSQNLVRNPSFENYIRCPESIGGFDNLVTNWSTPNYGSTDYFNTCSKTLLKTNFFGTQSPRTGSGYSGFYVMAPENYREYIQGEFRESLIIGETYILTFYVSLAENSSHAIQDFGVLFLEEALKTNTDKFIKLKNVLADETNSYFVLITSQQFYTETGGWEKVTFEYTAKGFERFFVIGNFESNGRVASYKIKKSKNPDAAYYFIDDVSVEAYNKNPTTDVQETRLTAAPSLETDKVYTLKNVLFEFNKHDLLEDSKEELNGLYKYLDSHKRLQIEIYGHTDNVGSESRNDELSLLRAKEVALYLISKGLTPQRIIATGFGNRYPKSSNNTDVGRRLNRRVEFKLIKL
ncbi:OmpA family protein [Bizionia sp. KMM 8389]